METEVMVGSGMKISCSRDELVQKLGVVSRAVSTRTAVQILAGVLYGLGWMAAKTVGAMWFALAWAAVAVKLGWTDARTGGRTRGSD